MSAALNFKKLLGQELADALGGRFKYRKSALELSRPVEAGSEMVLITGANRASPQVAITLHFSIRYSAVADLERRLGVEEWPSHIGQSSLNRHSMKGLLYPGPSTWSVSIGAPTHDLVQELRLAVEGMAYPFFERFARLSDARDGLARDDSWCLGGRLAWRNLLLMDAALGDVDHFRHWSRRLDGSDRGGAEALLARLTQLELEGKKGGSGGLSSVG